MTARKKPQGQEWDVFVDKWYSLNHTGKVALSWDNEVSYETAKHWVSESGSTRKTPPPSPSAPPLESRNNTPTLLSTKPGIVRTIVLGDTHSPYQDDKVIRAVEKFLFDIKPDYVFYNGDLNDFYQVSDFSKDPARLSYLQNYINFNTSFF